MSQSRQLMSHTRRIMYAHTRTHIYMHICVYIHICVCVYIYICVYIYLCIYVSVCLSVCVFVRVCRIVHVYDLSFLHDSMQFPHLPEILCCFRKQNLDNFRSCCINHFVVQIISLRYFQKTLWYK